MSLRGLAAALGQAQGAAEVVEARRRAARARAEALAYRRAERDKARARAELERRRERARARSPLYLRFGALPPGERSTTYVDRLLAAGMVAPKDIPKARARLTEAGVSCFRARVESRGEPRLEQTEDLALLLSAADEIVVDVSESRKVALAYYAFAELGRPAYLVRGTECPTAGSQDEALVRDCTAVKVPEHVPVRPTGEYRTQLGFLLLYASLSPTIQAEVAREGELFDRGTT